MELVLIAVLPPQAFFLLADSGLARFKAWIVLFRQLNGLYQLGLLHPAYLDAMLPGDFLDFIEFHSACLLM